MTRKPLTLAGLAIGCAAIGAFVAVGIWVWQLKAEVNRQTTYLAKRANEAGDAADHAIEFVGEVIGKARKDLENARPQTAANPASVNPFVQMTARQASLQLV